MKSFCPKCGRETHESAFKRKASVNALLDACVGSSGFDRECDAFAAGRRAAFKEAVRIVKRATFSHAFDKVINMPMFNREIRAAMKPRLK